MTIELDHVLVHCRDQKACARTLGELLGVPWSVSGLGPFSPVYVNDGLTIDFLETDQPYPIEHFCFRVDDATFDAILARLKARAIAYRSSVHGATDYAFDTQFGGRGLYWNEPDGHQWEMLTVSYARKGGPTARAMAR